MGLEDLRNKFKDIYNKSKKYCENYAEKVPISFINNLTYETSDIQKFIDSVDEKYRNSCILGLYISALINNKLEKEDSLELKIPYKLNCVGAYFTKGVLLLEGNVGNDQGKKMTGGVIIIKGDAGENIGMEMDGGIIIAKKIISIANNYKKGIIISEGETRYLGSGLKSLIDNKVFKYDIITDNLIRNLLKYPDILLHKDELFTPKMLKKYNPYFLEAALEAA